MSANQEHPRSSRADSPNLTELQLAFIEGLVPGGKLSPGQIRGALEVMKSVAYHEAGHVVARAFTGVEFSHITCVSIVPNATTLGRESSDRNFTELFFDAQPPQERRAEGRRLLIGLLAGHVAEAILENENAVSMDKVEEELSISGSDYFRANRIAELMGNSRVKPWKILGEAEAWCFEIMRAHEVWQCVEQLANVLQKRGFVDDFNVLQEICAPVDHLGLRLPHWKARFVQKQSTKSSGNA